VVEKISSFLKIKASFDILEDDVTKVIDFIEWAKNEISQRGAAEDEGERPSDRYIG
jgi:hypothetical protein